MMSFDAGYYLMVMSGPEDGRVFEINKDQLSIGSAETNDVSLRDDPFLRSFHASLIRQDGSFFLHSDDATENRSPMTLRVNVDQIFTLGQTEFSIKSR